MSWSGIKILSHTDGISPDMVTPVTIPKGIVQPLAVGSLGPSRGKVWGSSHMSYDLKIMSIEGHGPNKVQTLTSSGVG